MTKPASYTPPATAGTSPASAGNQRFNQPRPSGLHEPCAAMSGTHGSEGGSAGQPAGPTRHVARAPVARDARGRIRAGQGSAAVSVPAAVALRRQGAPDLLVAYADAV